MNTMTTAGGRDIRPASDNDGKTDALTLAELTHAIRNHLNTIKLSAALLQRRLRDELTAESLSEIGRSVDGINELMTRFMGDADAPSLLPRGENAAEA